jgi:hypothetical protein
MKTADKGTLHKSTHLVGWILDGRHRSPFYVEVEVHAKDKGEELSICGTHSGGGGQCLDDLADVSEFAPGWDEALRDRLLETWRQWHLNGLRSACEHQRARGETYKTHPGAVCPDCGYALGSAWLHEPLPAEVRAFAESLPNATRLSPYDTMAEDFLATHGLALTFRETDKMPDWEPHGDGYRVTVRRESDGRRLSFDWWDSQANMGEPPRPYSVLSSIAIDAAMPTDPDELARELGGDMKPSVAVKAAKFAKRLQEFFTEDELLDLAEI